MSKLSKKILAMCAAVVLVVQIALVSLVYRSVVTSMYWIPCVVLVNGPTISIATNSSSPNAGGAAVYADCGTRGCFLRILGMCLRYGRRLRPCRASKRCDVVFLRCFVDLDGQQSVCDITP